MEKTSIELLAEPAEALRWLKGYTDAQTQAATKLHEATVKRWQHNNEDTRADLLAVADGSGTLILGLSGAVSGMNERAAQLVAELREREHNDKEKNDHEN